MAMATKVEDQNSQSAPIVETSATVPRQNLIESAAKFLQNPKVRQSSYAQRISFLEKKGLSKEEIEIALEQSGTKGDEHAIIPTQTVSIAPPPVPVSPWARTKDLAATAILVGGFSYGVHWLFKNYIKPYLLGPSQEDKQMIALKESITQLQDTMAQAVRTLQEMQISISQQQEHFGDVVKTSQKDESKYQDFSAISEIKSEIQTLKGLLLSRKSFPTPPTQSLPAWQLVGSTATNGSTVTSTSSTALSANGTQEVNSSETSPKVSLGKDEAMNDKITEKQESDQPALQVMETKQENNQDGALENVAGREQEDSIVETSQNGTEDINENGEDKVSDCEE